MRQVLRPAAKAAALLASFMAAASGSPAIAGGISSVFTITQVFPREFGTDFSVTPAVTSAAGCTRTDAVRVMLTAQNYQMLAATMLTGFAMSKPMTVWVDHCDPNDGVPVFTAATANK